MCIRKVEPQIRCYPPTTVVCKLLCITEQPGLPRTPPPYGFDSWSRGTRRGSVGSIGRTVGVRGFTVRRGADVVVRFGCVAGCRFGVEVVCRLGCVVVRCCVVVEVAGRAVEDDDVAAGRLAGVDDVAAGRDDVVAAGRVAVVEVAAGDVAAAVAGRTPPGRRTPAESIIWLRTAVRSGPSVPMLCSFSVRCNPPAFPSDTLKVFIARHVFTTPLSNVPVELRCPSETTSNQTRAVARPTSVKLSPGCHDDSDTGVAGVSGELMICAGESASLAADGCCSDC